MINKLPNADHPGVEHEKLKRLERLEADVDRIGDEVDGFAKGAESLDFREALMPKPKVGLLRRLLVEQFMQ